MTEQVSPEVLDEPPYREDLYGFRWGPAVVERSTEYRMGGAFKHGPRRMTRVLTVMTDAGERVEVHISSSGLSLRVFRQLKNGEFKELV